MEVPAEYVLREGRASFRLGSYDRQSTLIIDPVLVYSPFFGGAAGSSGVQQYISAVAVDAAGNLYVTGDTNSTSFPVTRASCSPTPKRISFPSSIPREHH